MSLKNTNDLKYQWDTMSNPKILNEILKHTKECECLNWKPKEFPIKCNLIDDLLKLDNLLKLDLNHQPIIYNQVLEYAVYKQLEVPLNMDLINDYAYIKEQHVKVDYLGSGLQKMEIWR